MSTPKLYGIYIAQFPYLETAQNKLRPVVVISKPHSEYGVVAIIPVSTKSKDVAIDVVLRDWKNEGLIQPSVARVHRLTTMLQSDLTAEIGSLSSSDIGDLQLSLKQFLKL